MKLLFLILTLIVTYLIGTFVEKNHYRKIKKRELGYIKKPIVSLGIKKWPNTAIPVFKSELVAGEVVISGDYFKNFVASIKALFGGKLTTFESLMDRARREAILRMRDRAKNASVIVNVKIESVMIDGNLRKGAIPKCAVIAYGTALTYAK